MIQEITLSNNARRAGLGVLLADTFLMWCGFFMIIPLISVHYVDGLGWSAATIGVVLAVRQFTQQGLSIFSGMLADRFGVKGLICIGLLVRTLGFASMAIADSFTLLLGSAVLAAIGGALFESPSAAAIAALTEPEQRNRFYAVQGICSSAGMTLGPLLGAALLRYDFRVLALVAAAFYVVTLVITALLLPAVRVAAAGQDLTAGLRLVLRDQPFLLLTFLRMGIWFMWVQLSIALPLAARELAGTTDAVGWLYATNAGLSLLLQYPLSRLFERWLTPRSIMIVGTLIMALGIGSVAVANTIVALLVSVAVYSVGALLVMPAQQSVTASIANPSALGSYFGFSALALGVGGAIGNISGGALYQYGRDIAAPALPWLIFGAVGLLTAGGLWLQQRALHRQERAPVHPL